MNLSEQSIAYWDQNQVATFPPDCTEAYSLQVLNARNNTYPGLLELMPVAGFEGKTVIDFGCGPGHDTIMFLLNGAEFVYAVDASANGLEFLRYRLRAHRLEKRCMSIHYRSQGVLPLKVDHVHTAGVVHHLADPVGTLAMLRECLKPEAEIRMMVYDAESQYVRNCGGPEEFEKIADGAAPIAKAWTKNQVREIAAAAGLTAIYVGGYLMAGSQGPGLGGCWRLRP